MTPRKWKSSARPTRPERSGRRSSILIFSRRRLANHLRSGRIPLNMSQKNEQMSKQTSRQKNVETEVKVHVDDLAPIERKLQALHAELSAERVYERDLRYEDAQNTFTLAKRVLRLRQDTRARLTYKEPLNEDAQESASRTELEITVSDFDITDQLLQKIGFHVSWIYEKYRTTYKLFDCEIVLDEMPFGKFIEVEGDEADIERVLKALDLADAHRITESYSDLFFNVKDKMSLPFRDLTFENFKSVRVPGEYFAGTSQ